jgi:hypothetical protein
VGLKVNSVLAVTKMDCFVFQDTDYLDVAVKEANEVISILEFHDLKLEPAQNMVYNYNTFQEQL